MRPVLLRLVRGGGSSSDVVCRWSYRCTESTAAALQLPRGCARLLAQAQFAEQVGAELRRRGRRSAVLPGSAGAPLGHGGRTRRGRRTQTAAKPSEKPGEELQPPSIFLKAQMLPLRWERLVLPHCGRCRGLSASLSLLTATVIILLPGG